ncbi:hypothetical protein FRB91_009062 [Serendipita sp. 411]|nr:hypothetical protein FRC18_012270 [Serendipita sp. 400]KAG8850428.1 hypothetical protein FRB91_009062 [Serendipita sp. 411]
MMPLPNIPFGVWLLYLLASVGTASATYAFNKPQVRVTTTFADFHARIMDQWGEGGGKFVKISKDSHHPFEGRTFGGAKRREIRGSRAFGSGYSYGSGNHSTIARRPFPFGTWPLWWDQDFMESSEYGPHMDAIRPGGLLVLVPLRTTREHFNVTDEEVYYAIGDRESMLPLLISYVTWCHVVPVWPSKFDPTLSNSLVKLENVIQYFRASSFALASPAYNNRFARQSMTEGTSSPLPDLIEYSLFRRCVDDVTYHALAIMNRPPELTPLGRFVRALTVAPIFLPFAVFVALALIFHAIAVLRLWMWEYMFPERMDRFRAARQSEFPYENYP